MELDILGHPPGDMGPGRLIAQQFLDRVRDQGAILGQLPSLVRVLRQYLPHPTEEVPGGLDAGPCDDGQKDEDFLLAQTSDDARLVLELHGEEFGDEVIGGMLLSPGHVLGILVGVEIPVSRDRKRFALLVAEGASGVRPYGWLFRVRNAHEHADCSHGQFGTQVGHEVEMVSPGQRFETRHAEGTHLLLQKFHLLRSEGPRYQGPVNGVERWILVDENARRHHRLGLHDFQDVALGRAEAFPVL